jgi:hypothetical protein
MEMAKAENGSPEEQARGVLGDAEEIARGKIEDEAAAARGVLGDAADAASIDLLTSAGGLASALERLTTTLESLKTDVRRRTIFAVVIIAFDLLLTAGLGIGLGTAISASNRANTSLVAQVTTCESSNISRKVNHDLWTYALTQIAPPDPTAARSVRSASMKSSTTTGSLERIIRTIVQVAIASPAAFAVLLKALPISATSDAKVVGLVGAIYVIVVAVHNALESSGAIPAMLRYVPPGAALPAASPSVTATGDLSLASGDGSGGGASAVNPSMVNTGSPPPPPPD